MVNLHAKHINVLPEHVSKLLVAKDVQEEVDGIVELLAIQRYLPKDNDRWIVRLEQIMLPEKRHEVRNGDGQDEQDEQDERCVRRQ